MAERRDDDESWWGLSGPSDFIGVGFLLLFIGTSLVILGTMFFGSGAPRNPPDPAPAAAEKISD